MGIEFKILDLLQNIRTPVGALYLSGEKKLLKPALMLACLIAFSRLYLYVHYPTDILGGILVGIAAGYIGYIAVSRWMERKNKKYLR